MNERDELQEDLDEAVLLLAQWVQVIRNGGVQFDDWFDLYQEAARGCSKRLRAAIDAAVEKEAEHVAAEKAEGSEPPLEP